MRQLFAKFFLVPLSVFLFFGSISCGKESLPADRDAEARKAPGPGQRLQIPPTQAYAGAYVDFGDTEDNVTLEGLEDFEHLVGKHQAIIASSSDWSKNSFPRKGMEIIAGYGAVPLLFWLPWDREEYANTKVNRFDLTLVLKGSFDSYIDAWADQARLYAKPLLVAFGIEMNGDWFPWSGVFYGAGNPAPADSPSSLAGPATFIRAYRYVVDRVRAKGAINIAWVFHVNNTCDPFEPWNRTFNYYPGSGYVDWLALSAYGQQYPQGGWAPFDEVLPRYYPDVLNLDPNKPVILAEWGVGNFPKSGSMSAFIAEALRRLPLEFPRLKAAIYWHERWQNGDKSYSNLRVNATDEALEEYRKGMTNPFWLDRPVFGP